MFKLKKQTEIIITSEQSYEQYFQDLWQFKELFYFFAWRDILVRYRYTWLGFLWIVLRPLMNMAIFAFVFGKIAHLNPDNVNYPLFILTALIPWQLFSSGLIDANQCLVNNAPIISKIYFPRIILPISQLIVNLVDFMISLTIILFSFSFFNTLMFVNLYLFPFIFCWMLLLCLGSGFWISAINIRFRDFRILVPFILQFGLFISPIGYSSFLVPENLRYFYFINPLVGIIEAFRFCFFGIYHADLPLACGMSLAVSLICFISGFQFFRKMEKALADII